MIFWPSPVFQLRNVSALRRYYALLSKRICVRCRRMKFVIQRKRKSIRKIRYTQIFTMLYSLQLLLLLCFSRLYFFLSLFFFFFTSNQKTIIQERVNKRNFTLFDVGSFWYLSINLIRLMQQKKKKNDSQIQKVLALSHRFAFTKKQKKNSPKSKKPKKNGLWIWNATHTIWIAKKRVERAS